MTDLERALEIAKDLTAGVAPGYVARRVQKGIVDALLEFAAEEAEGPLGGDYWECERARELRAQKSTGEGK